MRLHFHTVTSYICYMSSETDGRNELTPISAFMSYRTSSGHHKNMHNPELSLKHVSHDQTVRSNEARSDKIHYIYRPVVRLHQKLNCWNRIWHMLFVLGNSNNLTCFTNFDFIIMRWIACNSEKIMNNNKQRFSNWRPWFHRECWVSFNFDTT